MSISAILGAVFHILLTQGSRLIVPSPSSTWLVAGVEAQGDGSYIGLQCFYVEVMLATLTKAGHIYTRHQGSGECSLTYVRKYWKYLVAGTNACHSRVP